MEDSDTEVPERVGSRRKSFRPRKLKRAYSPTWKAETRVNAKKKRKSTSTGLCAAIADRPYDKLPNGEPFSCAMCRSPYVSKPANRVGKTDKKRSFHMPYPKARTDPITGREMLICNPCSQTFEKPRRRRINTKITPTEQEVQKFLDDAKITAQYLADLYNEPDAARLYCPGGKNKTCGCLEQHIRQSGDEMANCVMMFVGLTKQAQVLREQKCYPIPQDDVCPTSPSKAKAKKVRNVGLGNGHKKCKAYEEFVIVKRQMLKEDMGLCERATQRVLLYSNNFLFKKLKTEPRPCRITRTKGKAALGQLENLDTIHGIACCNDNCVLMALTHRSLLQSWRDRAVLGQAEARRVLAEMLTPAGGYRLNCYKFISMVTGCAKGTIQRVNLQMRETGGNRDPPIHGMKKIWLEQHRASTETQELKKPDKTTRSQSTSKEEVTSQSKPTNNIAVSSFKVWQNELQQQQILKMQHRILEQQQQLLMQQQFFEVALNQQRLGTSSVNQSDKQTAISNLLPAIEQPNVNQGNVIQLQVPVQYEQVPIQFVLKQPNSVPNQLNPVPNVLNPVTNQLDPVTNQLNPSLNQTNLVLNQTQFEVVQDQNYSAYDPTISTQTLNHSNQTEQDTNLIKLATSGNQIQLLHPAQTFTTADLNQLNSGQIQLEVISNDMPLTVTENQVQLEANQQVLFPDNGKDNLESDRNTRGGIHVPPNVEVQPALQLDNIPSTVSMVAFENGSNNLSVVTGQSTGTNSDGNLMQHSNQVMEIQPNVLSTNMQIMKTSPQNDQNSNKIFEIETMATQPFQIQNLNENAENIPAMNTVQVTPQIQQLQNQIELASQLISATGNQYDSNVPQVQNESEENSSMVTHGSDGNENVLPQPNNAVAGQTFTVMYQNGVPIQAFLNPDMQTLTDTRSKADGASGIIVSNLPQLAEFETMSSDLVTVTSQSTIANQPSTGETSMAMDNTEAAIILVDSHGLPVSSTNEISSVNNLQYISTANSTQMSTNIANNETLVRYIAQGNEKSSELVQPFVHSASAISTTLNIAEVDSNLQNNSVNELEHIDQWKSQQIDNLANQNILIGQNSNFPINSTGQTFYAVISPNQNFSTENQISWIGQKTAVKTNTGSLIGQNSSIGNTNSLIGQNSSNECQVSLIDHNLSDKGDSVSLAVNHDTTPDDNPNLKKRWRKKSGHHNSEKQFKQVQSKSGKIYLHPPKQKMEENAYDRGKETVTSKPSSDILQTKRKSSSVLQSILTAPPKYVPGRNLHVSTSVVGNEGQKIVKSNDAGPTFVSHIEQTSVTPIKRNTHAPRAKLPRILKSLPHIIKPSNTVKSKNSDTLQVGNTHNIRVNQISGNQISSVLQGASGTSFAVDYQANNRDRVGKITTQSGIMPNVQSQHIINVNSDISGLRNNHGGMQTGSHSVPQILRPARLVFDNQSNTSQNSLVTQTGSQSVSHILQPSRLVLDKQSNTSQNSLVTQTGSQSVSHMLQPSRLVLDNQSVPNTSQSSFGTQTVSLSVPVVQRQSSIQIISNNVLNR